MADPPDLTPDAHVGDLLALTHSGTDLVLLTGFLGAEAPEGYVRLYVDAALASWIDLKKDDIVRRDRIEFEDGTLGGRSSVYVKGSAMRRPVRRRPAAGEEADFLSASPDIEDLVQDVSLGDVAEQATFLERPGKLLRTFRTCKR